MSGNQEVYQKAMDQGHSAAWERRWDQAAAFYREALNQNPDDAIALNSLGMALFELQYYDQALTLYQKAAQVSPADPLPLEKMGRILERQGKVKDAVASLLQAAELYLKTRDVDRAIETWARVCSLQPDHLIARTRLAMIFDRLGRKNDAVAQYLVTASIMQKGGDMAKAMQVVEYCLQIVPGSLEARQALSNLRANLPLPLPQRPRMGTGPLTLPEKEQPKPQLPAEQESERSEKPMDPIAEARQRALAHLADLLFEQSDDNIPETAAPKRGFGALSRGGGLAASESADRTRIMMHLGAAIDSQLQGADQQAAEDLERAVELGLREPAVFFDLGLLLQRREPQKATRHLQKVVKQADYALACYLLLGQIYFEQEDLSNASASYLRALALADTVTVPADRADELRQLYEPIVETQTQVKDASSIKKLCETISKQLIRPDWREFLLKARAELPVQAAGSPPLPLVEMLLESNSNQVVEAMSHIHKLTAEHKTYAAMEEIYYALQYAPTYLPLHVQIGDLLLQDHRTQEAIDKYMLVVELYTLRGETSQAIGLLQRIIPYAPMDLTVRSRLIDLFNGQGRVDEAIQQYIDLAEIYYQLAELDMAREAYSAAQRLAQKGNKNRTWAVQILTRLADIDMQRLDMRQAIKEFEQIRTFEPEDGTVRFQLVNLNYRMGQDAAALAEAESFASLLENSSRRALAIEFLASLVKENAERPELRKRLADLYVHAGMISEAVEQLDSIAESFMKTGNRAAASAVLQVIIRLNPPNVCEYRTVLLRLQSD